MLLDIYKYIYKNINKHYLDRYYKYINSIYLKGNRQLDYKENHHIIPKCIDESLYNDIDNKIVLTPREHYIAHLILNNGTINKRVPKSDIDIYLQNGWKLGALKRY